MSLALRFVILAAGCTLGLGIDAASFYVPSDFTGLGLSIGDLGGTSVAAMELHKWDGFAAVYGAPVEDGLGSLKEVLHDIKYLLGVLSNLIERAQKQACALIAALPYTCAYGIEKCGLGIDGGCGVGIPMPYGAYSTDAAFDSADTTSFSSSSSSTIVNHSHSRRLPASGEHAELAGKVYAYEKVLADTKLGKVIRELDAALSRTIKAIHEVSELLYKKSLHLHTDIAPLMGYTTSSFAAASTLFATSAGAWFAAAEYGKIDYAKVGLGKLEARVNAILYLLAVMAKQTCEAIKTANVAYALLYALKDELCPRVATYLPPYVTTPYQGGGMTLTSQYYYAPPLGSPDYLPASYGSGGYGYNDPYAAVQQPGITYGEPYAQQPQPQLPTTTIGIPLYGTVGSGGGGLGGAPGCPAGYFCPASGASQYCPAGYYCPANSLAPTPCPPGTVSGTGAIICQTAATVPTLPLTATPPCPAGSFNTPGTLGCMTCPAGYYCPAGSVAAYPCSVGTTSGRGAATCIAGPIVGGAMYDSVTLGGSFGAFGIGLGAAHGDPAKVAALVAALKLADKRLKQQIKEIHVTDEKLQLVAFGKKSTFGEEYGYD